MHNHHWTFVCRGFGEFPKQNTPEKYALPGTIEKCECKRWRIVPDFTDYAPVEVQPEEIQSGQS